MRARSGELSASIAVLGLVVEQPDSIAGIGRRLADRYPHARFARSSVHNNLPSLERQGLVRLSDRRESRALDLYEATEAGQLVIQEWLRDCSTALPALRDTLHAKLIHVRNEADLRALIEAILAQEAACLAEYATAHARLKTAERKRRLRSSDRDLSDTVRSALLIDEVALWGAHATRLKRLRECLDDAYGEDT